MTATDPVVVRRVRAAATAGAPRILLLHGLAGSGTVWDRFVERAGVDAEWWVADLPWRGDGVAGWAERDDVGDWAARAIGEVPGGAEVVVAHSFGATVLLAHLAETDRPPAAAVLVAPFYRARAADFDWASISYYFDHFDRILAEGIRVRSAGRVTPQRRDDMAARVRDGIGPYGWVRFFLTYLGTPRLRLARIAVPCLVVGGEHDFAAFPADAAALAAGLPDAELRVIPGAGHFVMAEHPDEFAGVVDEFIGKRALEKR